MPEIAVQLAKTQEFYGTEETLMQQGNVWLWLMVSLRADCSWNFMILCCRQP